MSRLRRTPESWRSWARGSPAPASSAADTPAAKTETQTPAQVRKYLLFLKIFALLNRYCSVREGSVRKAQEKWKLGAKKALLQWVQAQVSRQLGVEVRRGGNIIAKYFLFKLNIFWANIINQ